MKTKLSACLFIAAAAFAQPRMQSHPVGVPLGPAAPALGGIPVVSKPLGGISFSGAAPRKQSYRGNTGAAYAGGYSGYAGPVYYVPGPSDYASADFWNSGWNAPAPFNGPVAIQPPLQQQPQPIIINQYFDSRRPHPEAADEPEPAAATETPVKPGDPLTDPASYYLIEYKDHTIYTALAYWLEGDTLHYVTTQNTHNQASLSLIDLDKTYKLNEDRSVPFSIPGR